MECTIVRLEHPKNTKMIYFSPYFWRASLIVDGNPLVVQDSDEDYMALRRLHERLVTSHNVALVFGYKDAAETMSQAADVVKDVLNELNRSKRKNVPR